MSQEKNASISNTIKNTRERHTNMICKTYEVKVVMSKLSCIQKEELNAAFREAKWLRNDIISDLEHASELPHLIHCSDVASLRCTLVL